jgi:hypothetical protein
MALLPEPGPGRPVRSVLAVWSRTSRRRGTRPAEEALWFPRKGESVTVDTRRRAAAKESAFVWPSAVRYTEATWAEDRATRGRDPSADPGAKTGVGGGMPPLRISGIGQKAINPLKVFVVLDEPRGAWIVPRSRPSC